MIIRIQILFYCILLPNILFAQKFNVSYNPSLKTEKRIAEDTVYWKYTDSFQVEHVNLYPQNSHIIFKEEDKDSVILRSTYAMLVKDTLHIVVSKMSYGLQIKVLIRIAKDLRCDGEITYWTATMSQSSSLKINHVNLELNQNRFKKGQNLMGKLNIALNGNLPDEFEKLDTSANDGKTKGSKRYSEKSGRIIGSFNVIIDKQ